MPSDNPLVTVLCITKDRRAWLPGMLRCFEAQDWTLRELIVVSEGEYVSDLIPKVPNIRHFVFEEGSFESVGAKLNFGCALSRGKFIIFFFDDDYSAPDRVRDQVERLISTGKAVTGYHSMRYTDGQQWAMLHMTPQFAAPGSSLCFCRDWWAQNHFRPISNGEDNEFVGDARVAGQFVSSESEQFMYQNVRVGQYVMRGHGWHSISSPAI